MEALVDEAEAVAEEEAVVEEGDLGQGEEQEAEAEAEADPGVLVEEAHHSLIGDRDSTTPV